MKIELNQEEGNVYRDAIGRAMHVLDEAAALAASDIVRQMLGLVNVENVFDVRGDGELGMILITPDGAIEMNVGVDDENDHESE